MLHNASVQTLRTIMLLIKVVAHYFVRYVMQDMYVDGIVLCN